MSTSSDWNDFDTLRHWVRSNTVDRLKEIMKGFFAETWVNLPKSGKKQDLIDRIVNQMDKWRVESNQPHWTKARTVLYQVKNTGHYGGAPRPVATPYIPPSSVAKPEGYASSSQSSVHRPSTYATRAPANGVSAPPLASSSSSGSRPNIEWRHSPFLKPEFSISSIVECPESTSAMDRRQSHLTFNLTPHHLEKLQQNKYTLRLYCTSSSYYNPSSYKSCLDCPIEFPPTCEVRVNGIAVTGNLKGLKKKAGTAPPADVGKTWRGLGERDKLATVRVEMVYVNSQQGVTAKKYYMVVNLCEVTTVDQLVDTLKKSRRRSKATVLEEMRKSAQDDDDDIVAGGQKMSLRDSLTLTRVTVPSRSWRCVHPQCFDAITWYSMMEATTTFLCPVCEKVLNPSELIVDEYFEDILRSTDEEVEDVIVEPDGEWHTSDNRYASPGWRASHPTPPPPVAKRTPTPVKRESAQPRAAEVFVLDDSDEDDEASVKRELSLPYAPDGANVSAHTSYATLPPSSARATPMPLDGVRANASIIDLTLDSDDDDDSDSDPPPSRAPSTSAPVSSSGGGVRGALSVGALAGLPARPAPAVSATTTVARPEKRRMPTEEAAPADTQAWKRVRHELPARVYTNAPSQSHNSDSAGYRSHGGAATPTSSATPSSVSPPSASAQTNGHRSAGSEHTAFVLPNKQHLSSYNPPPTRNGSGQWSRPSYPTQPQSTGSHYPPASRDGRW